jgi:hypothetical protein
MWNWFMVLLGWRRQVVMVKGDSRITVTEYWPNFYLHCLEDLYAKLYGEGWELK